MYRYKVLDTLGAGAYGSVFKVEDIFTKTHLALKGVRMSDANSYTLSTREIAILQVCQSPYVVSLLGSWQEDIPLEGELATHHFILMELCSSSLRQAIESNRNGMEVERVKSITAQLTSGLAFVHSKDIIHRDLKPDNILLTADGTVKIADFGMSRAESPARLHTPRVVTLWYRSPELLLGAANYTKAVDLWSVGCIVAELLMGYPLIPAFTEIEMLLAIVKLFGNIDRSVMPAHLDLPLLDSVVLPLQSSMPACVGLAVLGDRDTHALPFIASLLQINPDLRLSCAAALFHSFIAEDAQSCSQGPDLPAQQFPLQLTLPTAMIPLPAAPLVQQALGNFALGAAFLHPGQLNMAYVAEVPFLPALPALPMQMPNLAQAAPVCSGSAMLPQASLVNPPIQPSVEMLPRTSHESYDTVSESADSVQVPVLPTLPVVPMQIPFLAQEAPIFPELAMPTQASQGNPPVLPPIEIFTCMSQNSYAPVSESGESVQATTSTQITASDSDPHQCWSREEEDGVEVIVIEDSSEEGDRATLNSTQEDDDVIVVAD